MASCSGPTPKNPRVAEECRRFLPTWENEFPWVSVKDGAMYCEYCKEAGKHNALTSGFAQFKKDTLKKHVAIVDHHIVLTVKSGKRDMQRKVGNIHWNREHAVYAALWTVYFMGEKNLPNNIFADLKQFKILQISNTPVR